MKVNEAPPVPIVLTSPVYDGWEQSKQGTIQTKTETQRTEQGYRKIRS